MISWKRHLEVIQAFCKLIENEPNGDYALLVFGGPLRGEYYNKITQFIKSQPSNIQERIIMFGALPAEIAIAVGDIFVGLSIWETWFLALTEVMYSQKPAIVSDIPILREVGGDGVYYLKEINTESIFRAMKTFANSQKVQIDFAQKGLIKSMSYTWENSIDNLANLISI